MNNRTQIPTGGAGLLLVALAVAPIVIKKCKPAIRTIGESISKAGDAVQRFAAPSTSEAK